MIADPSSCEPTDNPELPPSIAACIQYRAARLVRIFGLGRHDREDLAQTLALKVVGARARCPEAGRHPAFARAVLDLAYLDLARSLRRQQGRAPTPLLHPDTLPGADAAAGPWTSQADLRIDLETAIRGLPPDLAELAGLLRHGTVREAASRLGCHRGTAYRRIARIRSHVAGVFSDERDSIRVPTERSPRRGRPSRSAHREDPVPDPPPSCATRPEPQSDRGSG